MTKGKKKPAHEPRPDDRPPEPPADETPEAAPVEVDLQADRDDLMDRLQRVSADYANFQKRAQREKQDDRQFARADVIKGLLPVLDDMERVLDAARENHGEDDPLFQGMQLVHAKALEALGKFGLTAIDAVGQSFDPDRHAALMQQPSDDAPDQTVLQELQKGYALNGRTLRPSGVVVSCQPPTPDEPVSEDAEGPEDIDADV